MPMMHERCEETGGLFEVGGGYYAKLRWERTAGGLSPVRPAPEVEDLEAAWDGVVDFSSSSHPESVNDSLVPVLANLQSQ